MFRLGQEALSMVLGIVLIVPIWTARFERRIWSLWSSSILGMCSLFLWTEHITWPVSYVPGSWGNVNLFWDGVSRTTWALFHLVAKKFNMIIYNIWDEFQTNCQALGGIWYVRLHDDRSCGADVDHRSKAVYQQVAGLGRIACGCGWSFLYPGTAYDGLCFPV